MSSLTHFDFTTSPLLTMNPNELSSSTEENTKVSVEKTQQINEIQLKYLDLIYKIIEKDKDFISNTVREYATNYGAGKIKKGNKGGPLDNFFERLIKILLMRNQNLLEFTFDSFNEFVVPDIVEVLNDCVLCIDAKTNNGDGDKHKNKIHLGANQSNLGSLTWESFVSKQNPQEKWGEFKGDIVPFYKEKPTITFIIKLLYSNEGNTINCDNMNLQIFLIPHRNTFDLYKKNIKRGGNKSSEEQRLEINDDKLKRFIDLH